MDSGPWADFNDVLKDVTQVDINDALETHGDLS